MGEFDIYKWNNERRLAAVNEESEKEKSKHEKYLDVVLKWLEDAPQAQAVQNYIQSNKGLIIGDWMSIDFDSNNKE